MSDVTPAPFSQATTIDYFTRDLRAIKVIGGEARGNSRRKPISIEIDGQKFRTSKRFFRSFFQRYGINEQVFKYYAYDEVLERIASTMPGEQIRLCAGTEHQHQPQLYGVSGPTKAMIDYDQAREMVTAHGATELKMAEGVLQATHTPRSGDRTFQIGGDAFSNRIMMELPIDGFGDPRMFLMLLRQVCTNGMVGYARAFRSDIRLGNDSTHTLERALGMFDNEEGFSALRSRFESAQTSFASIREVVRLEQTILAAMGTGGGKFLNRLRDITGDLNASYGIANLESLSVKKQRVLPARCKVYDLMNYATEIASHKANPVQAGKLQAWLGTLVSDEFDMEGTAAVAHQADFQDLFLQ